jgi:hypothetical protein
MTSGLSGYWDNVNTNTETEKDLTGRSRSGTGMPLDTAARTSVGAISDMRRFESYRNELSATHENGSLYRRSRREDM